MSGYRHWMLSALLPALLLAGCGGSGSGIIADGGTSGTGISRGSVTALSSITLNGNTLETTGAAVRINGQPAQLSELSVGQVVRVEADFGRGTAQRIELNPQIVGPVDAVSLADGTGTLTVMGQPVAVQADTRIADFGDASAIAVGDRIRVSGLAAPGGGLVATHISLASSARERVIATMHSPGSSGAATFGMGGLTVDHSQAESADFPGGSPSAGDRLLVVGQLRSDGVLRAERVEPHDALGAEPGDAVRITGILEGLVGTDRFAIEQTALDLEDARIENGPAEPGDRVRVIGTLDSRGRIDAATVRVDP